LSLGLSLDVFPNPATSLATIRYEIDTEQAIVIQVIDFTGRLMEELNLGNQAAGEHRKTWNTEYLAQGVYFLRLKGAQGVYQQVVITR
jgi:hypothetical protein